jgi:hypothetical protein
VFINNLETGLKREKGSFWAVIPRLIREEKAPKFNPISLKEHQMR